MIQHTFRKLLELIATEPRNQNRTTLVSDHEQYSIFPIVALQPVVSRGTLWTVFFLHLIKEIY